MSSAASEHSKFSLSSGPMHDGNPFKLGLFGPVFNTTQISTRPSSFELTWEHTKRIAQLADQGGLDFILPPARWAGFGGPSEFMDKSFDSFNWVAAAAAVTERIAFLATTHTSVHSPITIAKQSATLDHIAGGRLGINLTMGWVRHEIEMFGIQLREHDERYKFGAEWVTALERLWTEDEPFDFDGEFITLKQAQSKPKPISKPRPVLVNAGNSNAGIDFSARYCDYNFATINDLETGAELVQRVKSLAENDYNRQLGVMTYGSIVCRPTEKEAKDAFQNIIEHADYQAGGDLMRSNGAESESFRELINANQTRFITSSGGSEIVGTPEQVAEQLKAFHDIGIGGFAVIFQDFAEEIPYFTAEVLPLLKDMGVRL